ncbi:MAG: TlpA family protein disulfide reductase [Chloroflexi bacterium]|nr:MAG: TlpA family protein disulfide reductase [Chloroflexota bacterium]
MSRRRTSGRRKRRAEATQRERNLPRSWLVLATAAVIVVAIIGAFALSRAGSGGSGSAGTAAGRAIAALDFEITLYRGAEALGGEKLNLSDVLRQGKPVVLNFWAGQCPPCRAEMPGFQSVYDEMEDQFILLGVDIGPYVGLGSREDGKKLVQELNITYPVGTTFDPSTVARYKIRGMPTTVFLNADGEIVETHPGFLDTATLRSKIQTLF